MYTKYIQNDKIYTKCIQNVYKLYTKCIQIVYKMTKCIQNVYISIYRFIYGFSNQLRDTFHMAIFCS